MTNKIITNGFLWQENISKRRSRARTDLYAQSLMRTKEAESVRCKTPVHHGLSLTVESRQRKKAPRATKCAKRRNRGGTEVSMVG